MKIKRWKSKMSAMLITGLIVSSVPVLAFAEQGKEEITAEASNTQEPIQKPTPTRQLTQKPTQRPTVKSWSLSSYHAEKKQNNVHENFICFRRNSHL